MRHASIQTTMNVYGRAMTDSKRQTHRNVVEMVLQVETAGPNRWLICNLLEELVAGDGFEPPTFGL